jgi:hypothetical protein
MTNELLEFCKDLSRGQRAFANTATHLGLFNVKLNKIEIEEREETTLVKLFFYNAKNGRTSIHSVPFYNSGELDELQLFLDLLYSAYGSISTYRI